MCLILVIGVELFETPALTPFGFCLCGWMKSEVNKIKVDTPDELLLVFWMLLAA
jgi:hypothetical protein